MADQNTLTFTDANFDTDVLRSDVPVLVDVWSEGCGACRQLVPLIDVVAGEYAGKAKVGKLEAMSKPQYCYAVPSPSSSHIIALQRGQRSVAADGRHG